MGGLHSDLNVGQVLSKLFSVTQPRSNNASSSRPAQNKKKQFEYYNLGSEVPLEQKRRRRRLNHLTTTLYFTMHVKFYLFFIVDVFVSYNLFLSLYVLGLLMSCE